MPQKTDQDELTSDDKYGPIPEGEFVVYGIVYAHAEHADALEALYRKMTQIAQTEPGVIHYCLARSTKDPSTFHFFERYASKEYFEAHTRAEGTQKVLTSGWVKNVEARFEKPIM